MRLCVKIFSKCTTGLVLYFINKDVKKLKGKSKEEIQNYVDENLDNASKGTILKNIFKFFSDLFF